MHRRVAFALGSALLSSSVNAADKPVRLPTEKWVVNFADSQCIASRNYGSKQEPLFLVLKEPVLGDVVQLFAVKAVGAQEPPGELQGSLAVNGGPAIPTSMLYSTVKETRTRSLSTNMPRSLVNMIAASQTIRVFAGYRLDETFQISSMPQLLKILDECAANLRQVWNVSGDGVQNPNLKQASRGPLTAVFSPDDYPGISLDRNEAGAVRFALLIDETGKVADCSVIQTSGIAALDTQSCAIVKQRARFAPAIGIDGKPAKTALVQTINWRMED